MRKFLFISILIFSAIAVKAQFKLVVNEVSQGNGGTKEYVELLVVGTRTCTDSTADIRNWLFDDQNGWYGAAGTGLATGHYRFANNSNWAAVPYGSVILLYNNADKNRSISLADDPTDANHDYTYVVPINSPLIEINTAEPRSPSSSNYVYPTTGYVPSNGWSGLGLSNTGDAVIITDPSNLGSAEFSIIFGITSPPGFQIPTVTAGPVAANKNTYLSDSLYSNASSWVTGSAGTADETPGNGNTVANTAWIEAMRMPFKKVALSSITQPTCTVASGAITITSPGGAGYMYSIDGASYQANPAFASLAPKTYIITIKSPAGCITMDTTVINAAPAIPTAPASTIVQPTCTTTTGSITITAPVGANYSYSIDGTYFQPNVIFSGLSPNTYTITVKNTMGCTSTGMVTINAVPAVPAAPTATIVQPTCTTSTGIITITSPVGPGYTYSIDGTSFQSSTTLSGLASNIYTIIVKNTDGCTSTNTVIINAAPVVPSASSLRIVQPTCTTPTGAFTITAPVGANYSYSIDGTNFQPGTTFSGLAPNTYTVTVKNTDGCTSTSTLTINAAPNPPTAPTLTTVQPTCTTSTRSITITSPIGSGFEYSVDGTSFQPGTIFSGLASNTYTVTVKNADGCIAASMATIDAPLVVPAAAAVTIEQPTCATPTGNIIINGPGGTDYSYSLDGTNFQDGNTFTGLVPNTYVIIVKIADGCTSTMTTTINNAPGAPPVPVSTVIQPTCAAPTGEITITAPVGANYSYSIDGTNFQAGITFSGLAPNTYTVSVKDGACVSTGSVTINKASQTGIPTVNSSLNYCQNATATPLTAVGNNLLWYTTSTGGTGSATAPTPSTLGIGTIPYYVSQTINGCESQRAIINVTVSGSTISLITGNTSLCVNGVINSVLSNPIPGGTWSSTDASIATVDNTGNVTSVSPGSTLITYMLNSGGCNRSVSTTVNVDNFTVNLSADANPATQGMTINLNTTAATPFQVTAWMPVSTFPQQTTTSQSITADNSATYSVIAKSAKGCVDTAQIAVSVTPGAEGVFIPNAFSPNNDGKNDIFKPVIFGRLSTYNFAIYNRYGQRIFYSTDGAKGWDGTIAGSLQNVGIYVWIFTYQFEGRKADTKKGTVALLR